MPTDRSSRVLRFRTPALIAAGAAVVLVLAGCSSTEPDEGSPVTGEQTAGQIGQGGADVAVSEVAERTRADTDDDPAGAAAGANSPADGVFAGVPVIDGEISHDRSGTLTNGGTDHQEIGVDTGLTWQEASDQVREQLLGAGLIEQSWAAADKDRNRINVRAVYERGDVLILLKVNEEGNVAYDAREMPTGSFAEQHFACGVLRSVPVEVEAGLSLIALTTGEPVAAEDVDLIFAYADALGDRVPAEVSTALAGLRDAAAQTVGLPAKQTAAGTEIADALEAASGTLKDARGAFCPG